MRTIVLCLILLAAGAVLLPATSIQDLTFQDLVQDSDRIVEVQVLDAQSFRRAGGGIETRYQTAALRSLKRTAPALFTFEVPGGVVPGKGMVLPGLPALRPGERYFLFLGPRDGKTRWVLPTGLATGIWRVIPGAGTASAQVVTDTRLLSRGGTVSSMDYETFVDRVMDEVVR